MLRKIREKLKLNNKAFTLLEILLAVGLTACASIAIGAMILSTQNSTTKMLNETELQQQITEVQETLHNDILATSTGIKYWITTDGQTWEYATKDSKSASEKILALYNLDQTDYVMTKTYYRWSAEKQTLEKAELTEEVTKDIVNKQTLEIDTDIKSTIAEIESGDGWTLIAVDLTEFEIDLSNYEKQQLVAFSLTAENEKSSYPTNDTLYLRNDVDINDNPTVDKYHTVKLSKPILENISFVYDGQEHGPNEINYDDRISRYVVRSSSSVLSATDAGTYTVRYTLKDPQTSTWEDGSTSDIILEWRIEQRVVGLVWGETEWVYDAEEHQTTCMPTNVVNNENCKLVLVNNNVGPDIGSVECVATVNNQNYTVPSEHSVQLVISPNTPAIEIDTVERTYNGEAQSMVSYNNLKGGTIRFYISELAASPNADEMVNTTCTAVNAGSYYVWYQLLAINENYVSTDVIYLGKAIMNRLNTATFTVSDKIYNEQPQTGATGEHVILSGSVTETNAGTYAAYAVPDDNHAWEDHTTTQRNLSWKIKKADITVTAPTPNDLTYNGESQVLCAEGSAPFGTMMYRLEDGGWEKTLPTAINAGTYKVYYYSTGDSNHNATSEEAYITVEIKRQQAASITVSDRDYTGGQLTGVEKEEHVNIGGIYTAVEAGTYEMIVEPKSNYAWIDGGKESRTLTWKILAIDMDIVPPTPKNVTYTGDAQTLVIAGSTPYGEMMYKLEDGEWSKSIPSATDAGEYKVYYYGTGDNNHNPTNQDAYVTVTMKRNPDASVAYLDKVYNTEEQTGVIGSNVTLTGDYKAVEVGTYTAYATPTDNYAWEDGSIEERSIVWHITRLTTATAEAINPTYTGEIIKGVTGEHVTWSGDYEAINAGTYIAYATPTGNYAWPDGTTDAKEVIWTLQRAVGATITIATDRVYTGGEQSGFSSYEYLTGWDGEYIAIDAGIHVFTVSPDANHTWPNGETSQKTFSWVMARAAEAYVTTSNPMYSGEEQNGYSDFAYIAEWYDDYKATNAGNYAFTAIPDNNHVWVDGSDGEKEFYWTLERANTANVVVVNPTYSGEEQRGYDESESVGIGEWNGDCSAINADSYTLTAKPDANHTWEDGTDGEKSFTWTIKRATGASVTTTNRTYSGSAQNGYSASKYIASWSGTVSATNAGNYNFYATPDSNHTWDDGTTDQKLFSWTMNRSCTAATANSSNNYTGSSITGVFGSYVTWTGTTAAISPGTYYAYATPDANHAWSNGGTETRTVTWWINGYTFAVGDTCHCSASGAGYFAYASRACSNGTRSATYSNNKYIIISKFYSSSGVANTSTHTTSEANSYCAYTEKVYTDNSSTTHGSGYFRLDQITK